jgi:hypothetical protein
MWGINMTNTRILWALCHPRCSDVIPTPPLSLRQTKMWLRSGPLRQPLGRQDGGSGPLRQPIGRQDGGGSGKSVYIEWQRYKSVLAVTLQGWGGGRQYKMYNSLIFINFISRSKKVKPKSKSCIKHFSTLYKLLRLWYFVSVLNLKFLDQLERRHCKDTPF